LGFFARGRLDHRAGFRQRLAAQLPDESLDALIASSEAAAIHQVLPDPLGVAALGELQLDGFPVGLAGTAAGGCIRRDRWQRYQARAKVGGHFGGIGRFCCLRVGGHFVGRFCRRRPSPTTGRPQTDASRTQIISDRLSSDAGSLLDLSQRPSQPS